MIDTHSHIYLEEFDEDRAEVISRAKAAGVEKIILPNVDESTLAAMLELEQSEPNYFYAAIGLHPTSVNADWEKQLQFVENQLQKRKFIAVGEIGLDFYWDKTFVEQQKSAFDRQVKLAVKFALPVIIHCRDAFDDCYSIIRNNLTENLRGVFHSFGGTVKEAEKIIALENFKIGINGIATYKNSGLSDVLKNVPLEYIVMETDAPYLTPVPFRGKRNESAYIKHTVEKLATVYQKDFKTIDDAVSNNARELFWGKTET